MIKTKRYNPRARR